MKKDIQRLINQLFWEKYIDVISDANSKEFIKEFEQKITRELPSAIINVLKYENVELNETIFTIIKIKIEI